MPVDLLVVVSEEVDGAPRLDGLFERPDGFRGEVLAFVDNDVSVPAFVVVFFEFIEVFSPDAFVEGEDDQGCGGDRGDGSGIEGDVLEGLEVLDQGVGPLGGSPH